jgi:hypothetical protein
MAQAVRHRRIVDSNGFRRPLETHEVPLRALDSPWFRLDAAHYRDEFLNAIARVSGGKFETRKLGALAKAFVPLRMRLTLVDSPHAGAPYLRAHDAFAIRPSSSRFVAKARSRDYESLLLNEGMILTPSSGRNLGPMAYVGKYLTGFAMTDIIRIVPADGDLGFYLLAYLLTDTAQTLIRRGRTGTTVDHLAPNDLLDIDVPWLDEPLRVALGANMRRAESLLQEARVQLDDFSTLLHRESGLPESLPDADYISRTCGDAFTVSSRTLSLRLDAASHDPITLECREQIRRSGGISLADAASLKTLARYRRYYIDPPNGRPVLSGRQMLQLRPVNLRHISDRSFDRPEDFVLGTGSTIFTCDGRSEDALGAPAYVMSVWNGWMASEHVMRADPKNDLGAGYLYLALASPWVQRQLKARATGSVIDALEPEEISDVMLPFPRQAVREAVNRGAIRAWDMISESIDLSSKTAAQFEDMMRR